MQFLCLISFDNTNMYALFHSIGRQRILCFNILKAINNILKKNI